MFLVVAKQYIAKGFYAPDNAPEYQELYGGEIDETLADTWEYAREEACRLTWRPYMYYPGLTPLLHRLKRLPTLILWGKNDAIVPVSVGEAYQAAIPGAQLVVFETCGHHPEVEQIDAFVQQVGAFLHAA
jgi:pimeloyl-ACP methyl ester carboxylesterase